MNKIDITGKRLLQALAIIVLVVVVFSYIKYEKRQNFSIFVKVDCEENDSMCFVEKCTDSEECNLTDSGTEYQIVTILQKDLPVCSSLDGCPEIDCSSGEYECSLISCDELSIQQLALDAQCKSYD